MRPRTSFLCALAGTVLLAAQPLVDAAAPLLERDPVVVTGGRSTLERSFDALCAPYSGSVVRVIAEAAVGDARLSHGVAVGEQLVLAKLSELGSDGFFVVAAPGERRTATLLASDLGTDLALLEVDGPPLTPLAFEAGPHQWRAGQWVGAAGPDGSCLAVGAVSTAPRDLPTENHGLLGVYPDDAEGGAVIARLVDHGAARAAGLEQGDVILAVDGRGISGRDALVRVLRRTVPGQEVELRVRRGEQEFVEVVRMRSRRPNDYEGWSVPHAADNVDVSARRDGFPSVVQHDAHLAPSECLTPAVDIRGRLVGLHLARMDRPGSLLLPADLVLERLTRLLEQAGRSAPAAPVAATREV